MEHQWQIQLQCQFYLGDKSIYLSFLFFWCLFPIIIETTLPYSHHFFSTFFYQFSVKIFVKNFTVRSKPAKIVANLLRVVKRSVGMNRMKSDYSINTIRKFPRHLHSLLRSILLSADIYHPDTSF